MFQFLFFLLFLSKSIETIDLNKQESINNENNQNQSISKKEKPKFYVQFMRPHKGPSNGGFQLYVQLDPEQEPPVYFRFDKQIIKARLEKNGLFSCWSPEHEIGKITIDVSPDQLHWVYAGELTYERDYTIISRLAIVLFCIVFYFGALQFRKYFLKKYKTRKSDDGQNDPLIPKTKNLV